ncbi:hypothetical protein PDESU_00975 [Pontiella desulfatans]|uniref:Uncharacterized protein n=1 Tax=Pontiella desulfatans TaxID=2750659 RepID=A0A6C2TXV1_PONDE|nr:hypothetical protein [Pontiella desulfatans]VGO12423.1 hypothetical protein PDESU_00975 [Pontiella desulfatans]
MNLLWGGLVNSDGTASGKSAVLVGLLTEAYAYSASHPEYDSFATNAVGLMSDHLLKDNALRHAFIEGLKPGMPYELVVYGAAQSGRDARFVVRLDTDTDRSIDANTTKVGDATTDAIEGPHPLTEGADYVRISFTPNAVQDTLWIEYLSDADADIAVLNGLQLAALGTDLRLTPGDDGSLVLSWENGASYNVMTNTDLMNGEWGVSVSNAVSPVTNAIPGLPKLFYTIDE